MVFEDLAGNLEITCSIRYEEVHFNQSLVAGAGSVDKTGQIGLPVEIANFSSETNTQAGHDGRLPRPIWSNDHIKTWSGPESLIDVSHEVLESDSPDRTLNFKLLSFNHFIRSSETIDKDEVEGEGIINCNSIFSIFNCIKRIKM